MEIKKCHGINCGIKTQCLRYMAFPGVWQIYTEPGNNFSEKNGCYLFLEIENDGDNTHDD